MVALTTLALASPPDPTWIAGFWDDADYDDVIVLAICSVGAVPHPVSDPSSDRPVIDAIVSVDEASVPAPTRSANQTRAPPA